MKKFKILIYKNIIIKIFLLIQIISGLFLSIHYCPNVDFAFKRISHIIKDVNSG